MCYILQNIFHDFLFLSLFRTLQIVQNQTATAEVFATKAIENPLQICKVPLQICKYPYNNVTYNL